MKNNELDKFYTNPLITDELTKILFGMFNFLGKKSDNYIFIEPSAGSGNFVKSLLKLNVNKDNIFAYDIDPCDESVTKKDFFKVNLKNIKKNKTLIAIGNPPFGKKGKLALKFLNKLLKHCDIVALILPKTFDRYSIQKYVNHNAKLLYSNDLKSNIFLVNDKEYNVNCVFQIWANKKIKTFITDQRLRENNFKSIEGLNLYIHNNTKETLKFFNKDKYNWNFAVHRQGYYDYSLKITNPDHLIKNRQYLFISSNDSFILEILNKINFSELSRKNTTTLGFSNTDLIKEIYEFTYYNYSIKNKNFF